MYVTSRSPIYSRPVFVYFFSVSKLPFCSVPKYLRLSRWTAGILPHPDAAITITSSEASNLHSESPIRCERCASTLYLPSAPATDFAFLNWGVLEGLYRLPLSPTCTVCFSVSRKQKSKKSHTAGHGGRHHVPRGSYSKGRVQALLDVVAAGHYH